MTDSFFGKNLRYMRESKGLKITDMLDQLGFKRTTWYGYESNDSTPNLADLVRISEYFDVSESDLLHRDLTKANADDDLSKAPTQLARISGQQKNGDRPLPAQGVPFYSNIYATAGVIELFSHTHPHVPLDHIHIPNMPKCDGAIPITGDSMYPLLKSGDIVLYKEVKDKRNIIWGEMYIAAVVHNGDDFFFVKYIQKGDKDGTARFVSQNNHHQPVEFPIDSIRALGLVKASIRINASY